MKLFTLISSKLSFFRGRRLAIINRVLLSGSFLFLFVTVVLPEEACAATYCNLYECPTSIVVWYPNASVPFSHYSGPTQTLPNGHPYCAYTGMVGGDRFAGVFDRVLGEQVTWARVMSGCQGELSVVDERGEQASPAQCYVASYKTVTYGGLGAKCPVLTYGDPNVQTSAGTDSNYFVTGDCEGPYQRFNAILGSDNSGIICDGNSSSSNIVCWRPLVNGYAESATYNGHTYDPSWVAQKETAASQCASVQLYFSTLMSRIAG